MFYLPVGSGRRRLDTVDQLSDMINGVIISGSFSKLLTQKIQYNSAIGGDTSGLDNMKTLISIEGISAVISIVSQPTSTPTSTPTESYSVNSLYRNYKKKMSNYYSLIVLIVVPIFLFILGYYWYKKTKNDKNLNKNKKGSEQSSDHIPTQSNSHGTFPASSYEILGITSDASIEDIKKSYKNLCLKYHSEKSKTREQKEKFSVIDKAYTEIMLYKENNNNADFWNLSPFKMRGEGGLGVDIWEEKKDEESQEEKKSDKKDKKYSGNVV